MYYGHARKFFNQYVLPDFDPSAKFPRIMFVWDEGPKSLPVRRLIVSSNDDGFVDNNGIQYECAAECPTIYNCEDLKWWKEVK